MPRLLLAQMRLARAALPVLDLVVAVDPASQLSHDSAVHMSCTGPTSMMLVKMLLVAFLIAAGVDSTSVSIYHQPTSSRLAC